LLQNFFFSLPVISFLVIHCLFYCFIRVGFAATAVLTALCGLMSALSPNYAWLLVFRALVGVGLGGAPVIFSLFMEFVPTPGRGFWLVAVAYFWTLGSVTEAALAWV
jgi:MFS family permease